MILTVTANAAIDKRYVTSGFEPGSVNRVKECAYSAGGKGLNVSRAAAIAGEQVTATGFLGGHAGRYIEEQLSGSGIRSEFIWCRGESRSCINIWDESSRTQTELLEPGFTVDEKDADRLAARFSELVGSCQAAAISGSLPSGADTLLYKRLLDIGRKAGKKVILDTSGKLLEDCIDSQPFMIKPNTDEIGMLLGRTVDPTDHADLLDAASKLHEKGISCVVISLGSEGSVMSCSEGAFYARVPKIDAVNTVGCGDSMIGGFTVGLSLGLSMEECLRLASGISASSAMTMETGSYRPSDLKMILPQIKITRLR